MKKILCAVIAFFIFAYPISGNVYAADKAATPKRSVFAPPPPKPAQAQSKDVEIVVSDESKNLSRDEMIADLKEMFEGDPDLMAMMPGLVVKDRAGKKSYEHKGKKLEELDKDTVLKLFKEFKRLLANQNMQRIQDQIQTIKQVNDMNREQRTFVPINPPSAPSTPPAPPRISSAPPKPPAPPRTYR